MNEEILTNPNAIYQMSIDELWNIFRTLCHEHKLKKEYEQVRYGINKRFDINKITRQEFTIYENQNKTDIHGWKLITEQDFDTEIEQRRNIMITTIMENLQEIEKYYQRTEE